MKSKLKIEPLERQQLRINIAKPPIGKQGNLKAASFQSLKKCLAVVIPVNPIAPIWLHFRYTATKLERKFLSKLAL